MCGAPSSPPPAPPPPAAPPVLEQTAPKSAASGGDSKTKKKAQGLSRYKVQPTGTKKSTTSLGGIPTKTGAGL